MRFTNIKNNWIIVFIVFTLIFLIGLTVYKDYGLTIDDEIYRKNGALYFEYIKLLLFSDIQISIEDLSRKIVGPNNPFAAPVLFELPLTILSYFLNFNTTKEIYTMSHLINFLIFFISLFFFYKLIKKEFNSSYYGLIAIILLFLTPRIFAESFYNSRDILFLSLFIFNIYTAKKFLETESYKHSTYFALTSALLVYSKVIGVVPPIIFLFIYFLNSFKKNKTINKELRKIIFIIFLTLLLIFIFWPFLWDSPFNNLIYSFQSTINEQNNHSILTYYFGEYISSTNTPWHYRLTWFLITTPILILFFFFIFYFKILFNFIIGILKIDNKKEDPWNNKNELFIYYLFIILTTIVFVVIKFNTSHFNSWRHIYFLYPIVIWFAISGFYFFTKHIKKKIIKTFIYSLIFLNFIYITFWIYNWHPYQYVYFNLLSKNYAKNNFDLDYWGLSNVNSIKYILENNKKKSSIKVAAVSYTSLIESTLILDEKDKKKIIIVYEIENADFIINNHMKNMRKNFIIDSKAYSKYFEIIVDGMTINTIYKKIN